MNTADTYFNTDNALISSNSYDCRTMYAKEDKVLDSVTVSKPNETTKVMTSISFE